MSKTKRTIILIVALFFTFIFGCICPTWATVTRTGLKILGALIGWLILAASGFGLLIPSLLALVAVNLSGYYSAADIFAKGIGTTTNITVILIFVLVDVFSESGTAEFVARWFLSRKFVSGRPYVLTATFLIVMVALGTVMGSFGIILLSVVLLENIASLANMDKKDDWIRFLLISIVALSGVTELLFPFKPFSQIFISLFNGPLASINTAVNESTYILTGVLIAIISIVLLMVEARFVFHFKFNKLQAVDMTQLRTDEFRKLNKKQTVILVTILLAFFYPFIIMVFPESIYTTLNGLGQALFMALCIAFLGVITIDGKPVMVPAKAFSRGVNWDIVFAIASVTLLGSALGADDNGFTPWLLGFCTKLFNNTGFVPILILTAILSCFMTQIFSNLATGMIIGSVLAPMSIIFYQQGINISIFPALIGIGVCSACLIPAGSGQSAVMLSTDIFKDGSGWAIKKGLLILVAISIACILAGLIVA